MFTAAVPAEGLLGGLCDLLIVPLGSPDQLVNVIAVKIQNVWKMASAKLRVVTAL